MFDHLPGVLGHVKTRSNRDVILEQLHQLHAECMVQEIISDRRLPFFIEKRQLKLISKELSKTIRACIDAILFYVIVSSSEDDEFLPSMFTKTEAIEDSFRYSDSVFVIDDNSFVLLGFASDRSGSDIMIDKIVKCMKSEFHDNVAVHIGLSIVPEDGKSFYELIGVVRDNMMDFHEDKPAVSNLKTITDAPFSQKPMKREEIVSDFQIFSLCFNKARGKFFHELITLPKELLWSALSRIPVSAQKRFFLRLPFNSPLISFLAEKIKKQSSPHEYETARTRVIGLISEMELVENLKERNENFKQISVKVNRLESIFAMPSIALQVYNTALDPESEIDDIVNVVLLDPSLSLKLLKIVNSPFYGLVEKIGSIREAVLMLGREEVVNMAFALSLSKSFLNSDLNGILEPQWLWRHSLGSALISKYLCRKIKIFNDTNVFTASLIHDLGKVFMVENFPKLYIKVIEQSREHNLLEFSMEEELTGFDHASIGRRITENWNLPETLVQAVAFHHNPSAAHGHSELAAIVGFADYLSHMAMDKGERLELKQLFKVDHTIILKKMYKNFDNNFIVRALKDVIEIFDENKAVFSIAK